MNNSCPPSRRGGRLPRSEQLFGPVAPVRSFASLEEAVAIASANEYGLSLGILGDVGTAMDLADLIPSGKIHINEQTV